MKNNSNNINKTYFTEFTSKNTLVKAIHEDGTKTIPAQLYSGKYNTYSINNLHELQSYLTYTANHTNLCLCLGVPSNGTIEGEITTNDNLAYKPNAISRSQQYIKPVGDIYPNHNSLVFIDFDDDEKLNPKFRLKSFEELISLLIYLIPDLKDCQMLVRWSSSSKIKKKDGTYYKETNSMHLFFIAKNLTSTTLANFKEYIKRVLWMNGYGCIKMSSDGKLLEQEIFDLKVLSAERIIITSLPIMPQGWTKDTNYLIKDGGYFDMNLIDYNTLPNPTSQIASLKMGIKQRLGIQIVGGNSNNIKVPTTQVVPIPFSMTLDNKLNYIEEELKKNPNIEIKALVALLDQEVIAYFLRGLGYTIYKNYKFKIRDEKTPSASIRANGYIKDFGGDFSGNIINFLHHCGLRLKNSINYLKASLGANISLSEIDYMPLIDPKKIFRKDK